MAHVARPMTDMFASLIKDFTATFNDASQPVSPPDIVGYIEYNDRLVGPFQCRSSPPAFQMFQPLSFFSITLKDAKTRHSTYNRELL